MALSSGTRLGPYEINGSIGEGGMGEVYRATDTRLERIVAIKVLPEDLAESPERKARFEREAKVVSQLNHPHICVLHDVGEDNGVDYLVMELIEGETLQERLKKGALPTDEALDCGIQIASALDRAHRAGIVHRDLKPANIMLTKTGVKLLDFGLAKSVEDQAVSEDSAAPTQQKDLTKNHTILGTLQYMAPEQVEGTSADARSDIFAFGALLYEMIAGRRAFHAENPGRLVAAILNDEPPSLGNDRPGLDRVLERCLKKDPDARWQNARDLELELGWVREGKAVAAVTEVSIRPQRNRWLVVATALATGLTAGYLARTPDVDEPPVVRSTLLLEDGLRVPTHAATQIDISPDGTTLVYAVEENGRRQLRLRRLDVFESNPIPGSDGGHSPVFSPDGAWIAFFTDDALRKVPVSGGTAQTICQIPAQSRGAEWSDSGNIVFGVVAGKGLMEVAASGGVPAEITTLGEGELGHRWPRPRPGGREIAFTIRRLDGWGGALWSRDSRSITRPAQLDGSVPAGFTPSGHFLHVDGRVLLAAPFDADAFELTRAGLPVLERFQSLGLGAASLAWTDSGTLVAVADRDLASNHLVWVERDGTQTPLDDEWDSVYGPRLAPNDTRLLVSANSPPVGRAHWVFDWARDTRTRIAPNIGLTEVAGWTPDGRSVVYSGPALVSASSDGSGQVETLMMATTSQRYADSWSPDGELLALSQAVEATNNLDIWILPKDGEAYPFVASAAYETAPRFSPDGRFIAYVSDESGRDDVYVLPFPGPGRRVLISSDGGTEPVWSPVGDEIFYREADRMMTVGVRTSPDLAVERAEVLFDARAFAPSVTHRAPNYDVTSDGQRFVMVVSEAVEGPERVLLIQNWTEELKRLVPTDR